MSLKGVSPLFHEIEEYQHIKGVLGEDKAELSTWFPDAARAGLLVALREGLGVPVVVITSKPEEARRLWEELLLWCGDEGLILHYPEHEALPFERLTSDEAAIHTRLHVLSALVGWVPGSPAPLVVAPLGAVLQKTIDRKTFISTGHVLARGERMEMGKLISRWLTMGYHLERAVEVPGTISRRGGIIDIFPPGSALPTRIELWGDTIDSMRPFNPITQLSESGVESLRIIPAGESLPALADREKLLRMVGNLGFEHCAPLVQERIREELSYLVDAQEIDDMTFYSGFLNHGNLLDYLHPQGLLILDGLESLEEAIEELEEQRDNLRGQKESRGELPESFPSPNLSQEEVKSLIAKVPKRLNIRRWADEASAIEAISPADGFHGDIGLLAREARSWVEEGQLVVAVTHHGQRLAEVMQEEGLAAKQTTSVDSLPERGSIVVTPGSLKEGFRVSVPGATLALLTDSELFGISKIKRPVPHRLVKREAFLSELVPGGYLVHIEHGIGQFKGTEKRASLNGEREYLILEYAQGDKLYVPTEHLDRVSPYVGAEDKTPPLTRLGTQEWSKLKKRAKESVQKMAEELLEIYAAREVVEGHAFSPDTPWQKEVESSFPYVETPDQTGTIDSVKADMERPRPMDRLVCGDVGYGKTEVALRAAFKGVMDGRQVAILVPTTVLAQQHYATFCERLSPFPTRIELLSRFRSDKEQKETVNRLKIGAVDIVIGTHRLLQKDVEFKELGLVIVDEEQRFGVAHKERLKQMRKEVDVLTLSATPIPRTLHMTLAGIRDMSTMETPPEARLPVKTYLSEYSDNLLREAVLREVDRGGQVFFLHNRVHSIYQMAETVRLLVPEARVGIGHGQMDEEALENSMLEFSQGKLDVLVCTTIIESGLDIPNANTLIINRADMFGLAQLYQLRGRVGRGAHRAYCYLLVPKGKQITETAEKRLKTILAATELGSGFRIAMKDLEIRGAGNILGSDQSGNIHAVGFDLYSRLLENAVGEIRTRGSVASGEKAPELPLIKTLQIPLDLPIEAYISESYVSDLPTRLGIYQHLAKAMEEGVVQETGHEMRDRFGPLPKAVEGLLYAVHIRCLAARAGVESIGQDETELVIRMREEVGGARLALQGELGTLARVGQRQVRMDTRGEWQERLREVLERLGKFTSRVASLP